MDIALHEKLVARQSEEELERKAKKSRNRGGYWTQEELDLASRQASDLADYYKSKWL